MGGFNHAEPEFCVKAEENHEQINCLDDRVREAESLFLMANPDILDPKCKTMDFLQELWKNESKVADLIWQMRKYMDKIGLIADASLSNVLTTIDMFTESSLAAEIRKITREFRSLRDHIMSADVRIARLQRASHHCIRMMNRLEHELDLVYDPDISVVSKKILNPDLDLHTVYIFMNECEKIAKSANEIVIECSVLQLQLVETNYSSHQKLLRFKQELEDRNHVIDLDDPKVCEDTLEIDWNTIQRYKRSTLNNVYYGVYSCAYRPPDANVDYSFSFPDMMTCATYFHGYQLILANELRSIFYSILKQPPKELPRIHLLAAPAFAKVKTLLISNSAVEVEVTLVISTTHIHGEGGGNIYSPKEIFVKLWMHPKGNSRISARGFLPDVEPESGRMLVEYQHPAVLANILFYVPNTN